MRRVAVITVGRSDYSIWRPVLSGIEADPELELSLIAGGAHCADDSGSRAQIADDGYEVVEWVESCTRGDSPVCVSDAVSRGVKGFAEAYDRLDPDIILVLGDRYEMFAAAAAAVPLLVPVAHVHGGELTLGAIDESYRHAITKMSHLHFASTDQSAARIAQMGEESWRITVSGAPSLDNLESVDWQELKDLETELELDLQKAPLLVTYHPVTMEYPAAGEQVAELVSALEEVDRPVVITWPNMDPEFKTILSALQVFSESRDDVRIVNNLGTDIYFSLMKQAAAMVGNSSSGIIEAASLCLPVVNIGSRQAGRLHPENVIDVECEKKLIRDAILKAVSGEFKESLTGMDNPYGDGGAAGRMLNVLRSIPLDRRLMVKNFADIKN